MAIMSDVNKCVVFYAGSEEERQVDCLNARAFFNHRGIDLILAGPAETDRQMGEISGLAEELGISLQADDFVLPEAAKCLEKQLFWLAGFDRAECTSVLKEMAGEGVGPKALKAMATDKNLHWTLAHLIYDVAMEHELITSFMEL